MYVREMMQHPEIKDRNHKSKMGAIAEKWREISEEDRQKYVLQSQNKSIE